MLLVWNNIFDNINVVPWTCIYNRKMLYFLCILSCVILNFLWFNYMWTISQNTWDFGRYWFYFLMKIWIINELNNFNSFLFLMWKTLYKYLNITCKINSIILMILRVGPSSFLIIDHLFSCLILGTIHTSIASTSPSVLQFFVRVNANWGLFHFVIIEQQTTGLL